MTRTFDTLIRSRLLAVIDRAGTNPTALALELGRSKAHLTRKLVRPHKQPRALHVEDVQEVLAHLELDPSVLFEPVLLAGDQELLDWIELKAEEEAWATLDHARATFAGVEDRIARLAPEGLITVARHPETGDVFYNPDPSDTRWLVLDPATLAPLERAA